MNHEPAYWQQQLKQLNVVVVLPTYNNGGTLGAVIDDVCQYATDIIVVNDGCTDNTAEILAERAEYISVITHETNKGKGVALQNALMQAKQRGYRYAITMDTDGQHFASDIPTFVAEIAAMPDSLLVGSRNLAANNMPGKNTFANRFSNFWYKAETGINLTDTQSGFRIYPVQLLNVDKWYYTTKYEFELEALVYAAWGGISVRNIPVNVYYPPQEERVSHFRPGRDFTRISILNTILVLVALVWIYPRNFFRKLSWENIKGFVRRNVTQSRESNLRISSAVALGVFFGIVPIWGWQMVTAFFVAHLLKLNKVITLVASNISLPPIIPFLLYGSYYTGCLLLGQSPDILFSGISVEVLKAVALPYILGSVVFAAICAVASGVLVWLLLTICHRKPAEK